MRSAGRFLLLAVGRAVKIFLLLHSRTTAEIHFLSAVRTVNHSRKHVHLAHRRRSSSVFAYFLYGIIRLFVDDRFLRILEGNPFRRIVSYLLLTLIGLLCRPEVYGTARIVRIAQDSFYCIRAP